MTTSTERFLCIASYEKGQPYLRQLAALGVRPFLLTVEKLANADWPREILDDIVLMPGGMTHEQIRSTVAWQARTHRFDRITALDEFDLEVAAHLREHMRIPGMGTSRTAYYRDKLAMRMAAAESGFRIPRFVRVLHYDDLRTFMETVPAPWLLKPRAEASALGIRRIHEPDQLWAALEELGDRQSSFLMEEFIPGDIFHVDSILSDGRVIFSAAHQYGHPPLQIMQQGGVFTTRTLDRDSVEWRDLTGLNAQLAPALGMRSGVTHAEYIRSHADGRFYFLEIAARVGGAFISDLVEQATGINLWREWARLDVAELRGEPYVLPHVREEYASSVLCLAREAEPDLSAFTDPEIAIRVRKDHHAGLLVRSHDPKRVHQLADQYAARFAEQFLATLPPPERPTD